MLTYQQAINTIFDLLPLPVEEMRPVREAAFYYLAEDIYTTEDLPGFDNSSMDGYAIVANDTRGATMDNHVLLDVVGTAPAGHPFRGRVRSGQAVYITTGAAIPEGADAVIPVEDVEINSPNKIYIRNPVPAKQHIRYSGEEIHSGQKVMDKFELLSEAHLGLLFSLGIIQIPVFKKQLIGFLATGDELVDVKDHPGPGQIRNSNAIVIQTMVKNKGYDFFDYGIAKDNKGKIKKILLSRPLPDILITSAGVSKGEHDLVIDAMESIGLRLQFWQVAVKPGKPVVFGTIGKSLYFGLPGNPVSGAVVFKQFVEPVLNAMSGAPMPFRSLYKARSLEAFKATSGRLHFARGVAVYSDGWQVRSGGIQGSHILTSLAQSNCFVLVPPDKKIESGDEVYIQLHSGEGIGREEFNRSFSLLLK